MAVVRVIKEGWGSGAEFGIGGWREDGQSTAATFLPGDGLDAAAPLKGLELPLREIYRNLEFPSASPA